MALSVLCLTNHMERIGMKTEEEIMNARVAIGNRIVNEEGLNKE